MFWNSTKFMKISFWYCLGALWVSSWRQDTAKATPGLEFNENCWIFRCLVGSKMEEKSKTNLCKNRYDFRTNIRTTFSQSWVDFGTNKLSKMRVLGSLFSTLLRIGEKCDFEQHSQRFAIFFNVGGVILRSWSVYFSVVFENALGSHTFLDLGWNFGVTWVPREAQNWWKNLCWFFNEILMAFGVARGSF